MNYNIIYSLITENILEKYYQQNFLDKEVLYTKFIEESIIRYIYNITMFIILMLITNTNNFLLNITKDIQFVQSKNQSYQLLYKSLLLCLFVIVYWLVKIKISTFLFPINERHKREQYCRNEIQQYERFIRLQKAFQGGEVLKISIDGFSKVTVTHIPFNGVEVDEMVRFEPNEYKETVKKDCLDFKWLDYKINEICRKLGFPEVMSI